MSSGSHNNQEEHPVLQPSGPKAETISLFPCSGNSQPSSPRRTGMEAVVTTHPTRLDQLGALGTTKKN